MDLLHFQRYANKEKDNCNNYKRKDREKEKECKKEKCFQVDRSEANDRKQLAQNLVENFREYMVNLKQLVQLICPESKQLFSSKEEASTATIIKSCLVETLIRQRQKRYASKEYKVSSDPLFLYPISKVEDRVVWGLRTRKGGKEGAPIPPMFASHSNTSDKKDTYLNSYTNYKEKGKTRSFLVPNCENRGKSIFKCLNKK